MHLSYTKQENNTTTMLLSPRRGLLKTELAGGRGCEKQNVHKEPCSWGHKEYPTKESE